MKWLLVVGLLLVVLDLAAQELSPIDPTANARTECNLSAIMALEPVALMQGRCRPVSPSSLAGLPKFPVASKPALMRRFVVRARPNGLQSVPFQRSGLYSWRTKSAFAEVSRNHTLLGFVIGGGLAGSLGAGLGGGMSAGLGGGIGCLTGGVLGLLFFTSPPEDSLLLGSMLGFPLGITIGAVSTGGDSKDVLLGLVGGAIGALAGSAIGAAIPNMAHDQYSAARGFGE
jgi:hypothetical protein